MSNFSFAENCCLNFSKFPHCPGSLNKETTFAYYTWLAQSMKTDIRKSIVSAIVFNYLNDIIDRLPGSKPNNALFYSKLY